jgi:hypothetical protein
MIKKQGSFKQMDLFEYEANIEKYRLKKLQKSALKLGMQIVAA